MSLWAVESGTVPILFGAAIAGTTGAGAGSQGKGNSAFAPLALGFWLCHHPAADGGMMRYWAPPFSLVSPERQLHHNIEAVSLAMTTVVNWPTETGTALYLL